VEQKEVVWVEQKEVVWVWQCPAHDPASVEEWKPAARMRRTGSRGPVEAPPTERGMWEEQCPVHVGVCRTPAHSGPPAASRTRKPAARRRRNAAAGDPTALAGRAGLTPADPSRSWLIPADPRRSGPILMDCCRSESTQAELTMSPLIRPGSGPASQRGVRRRRRRYRVRATAMPAAAALGGGGP
jgi:hypothetical protein